MQEFKNRPFWTAPRGLKRVACHVLAALSALQQRPHVPLSDIVNMDLYVWYILKYTCQVAVCEAESLVSKYICFDCLVRIFLRAAAHVGNYRCRNMAWLHLACAGVYYPPSPPPPDLVVHVCAPLLAYVVARCWWRATRWLHLVYGGLASPPSIDWVAHAHYHLPIQFSFLNYNFKI
jgi:hypothetical protein